MECLISENIFFFSLQWHILGQTVQSVDDKSSKHYDEQQIAEKMHNMEQKISCPKCQRRPELRMTEKELTKLRIEYIKNQILKKLRMTERPNVSVANLPKPVAEGAMIFPEDEEEQQHNAFEQFYGKTTQKIIFLELGKFLYFNDRGVLDMLSYFCIFINILKKYPVKIPI